MEGLLYHVQVKLKPNYSCSLKIGKYTYFNQMTAILQTPKVDLHWKLEFHLKIAMQVQ